MDNLNTTPIYRALHRPNLILGGERELVLLTALLTGGTAMVAMNLVSTVICTLVWLSGIAMLRAMAKVDPQLSRVYLRYLQYRAYYPARSALSTGRKQR